MEVREIFIMIIVGIPILLLLIIRLIIGSVMILNYENLKWYWYPRILLWETPCEYCNQIACRRSNPGKHNYCLNSDCHHKSHKASWTPFGQSSGPIDGSLGWKINKEITDQYQKPNNSQI